MGGLAAEWIHRRFAGGRLYFLAAVMALGGPLAIVFFVSMPGDSAFFLPAWFVTSLTGTIWFGPIFATVQDLVPVRIRSTVVAFLLLALSLLGTGPGPWITGLATRPQVSTGPAMRDSERVCTVVCNAYGYNLVVGYDRGSDEKLTRSQCEAPLMAAVKDDYGTSRHPLLRDDLALSCVSGPLLQYYLGNTTDN